MEDGEVTWGPKRDLRVTALRFSVTIGSIHSGEEIAPTRVLSPFRGCPRGRLVEPKKFPGHDRN
jgi:hypothetical protein